MNRREKPALDQADSRAIDRYRGLQLGVAVAGDPSSRVIRVNGHLTTRGAELLSAITDHFVRDGSRTVRMDLADVTAADHEGLESVERLRTSLSQQGVTLLVSNRSIAVHHAAVNNPALQQGHEPRQPTLTRAGTTPIRSLTCTT
ncbi:MAG: hypothetical protein JWM76_4610 [Pseudonocardiales bacterium]|nr:hypothetical protein [Pseudonocardiales bacterium]